MCELVTFLSQGFWAIVLQIGVPSENLKSPYLRTGSSYRQAVNGVYDGWAIPIRCYDQVGVGSPQGGETRKTQNVKNFKFHFLEIYLIDFLEILQHCRGPYPLSI